MKQSDMNLPVSNLPFKVEEDTALRESLRATLPRERPTSSNKARPSSSRPLSALRGTSPPRPPQRHGLEEQEAISDAFSKSSYRGIRSLPVKLKPAFRTEERGFLALGVREMEDDVRQQKARQVSRSRLTPQLSAAISRHRSMSPDRQLAFDPTLPEEAPREPPSAGNSPPGTLHRARSVRSLVGSPSKAPATLGDAQVVIPHSLQAPRPFFTGGGPQPETEAGVAVGQDHPGRASPTKSFSRFHHAYSEFDLERRREFERKEKGKERWMGGRKKDFVARAVRRPQSAHDSAFSPVRYLEDAFDFQNQVRRTERAESSRKIEALHRTSAFYTGARGALERATLKSFLNSGLEALSRDLRAAHPHFRGLEVDSDGLLVLKFALPAPQPSATQGPPSFNARSSKDGAPSPSVPSDNKIPSDIPLPPPMQPSSSPSSSTTRNRSTAPTSEPHSTRPSAEGAPTDPRIAFFVEDLEATLQFDRQLSPEEAQSLARLKREVGAALDAHPATADFALRRDGFHWGVVRLLDDVPEALFALSGPFTKPRARRKVPDHLQRPTKEASRLPWPKPADLSDRDRPADLVRALRAVKDSKKGQPPPPLVSPTLTKYQPPVKEQAPVNTLTSILGPLDANPSNTTRPSRAQFTPADIFEAIAQSVEINDRFHLRDMFLPNQPAVVRVPSGNSVGSITTSENDRDAASQSIAKTAQPLRSASPSQLRALAASNAHAITHAHPTQHSSSLTYVPFTKIPLTVAKKHSKTHKRTAVSRVPYAPVAHIGFLRPNEATFKLGGPITARDVSTATLLREAKLVQLNKAEFHA